MTDYIKITTKKDFGSISVTLNIKDEKVAGLGLKLKALNDQADMTGNNWEALLGYYLDEHHPDVSAGMGSEANAGKYTAYYKLTPQNEKKAEQLAAIIEDLIEDDSKLAETVKNNADEIDWD